MNEYDYYHGDCIVMWDGECVVERADPVVLADEDLVEAWQAGVPHVQLDDDVATFGIEGRGVGRVSYQIGGRYDQHRYVLHRIDDFEQTE